MDQFNADIKLLELLSYVKGDANNIVKKLIRHRKENENEPIEIIASVIGSVCFSLITCLDKGLWMDIMEELIEVLDREYKRRTEENK